MDQFTISIVTTSIGFEASVVSSMSDLFQLGFHLVCLSWEWLTFIGGNNLFRLI